MFRFNKSLDIVTLFHKASSPASLRAVNLLKQASAAATETATEDQASDHTAQADQTRRQQEFELDITEDPPTPDQLQTILEYVGDARAGSVVKGAASQKEALRKFRESSENFQRPVVVDWNNGKASAGGNESEILKMLSELKK